ncbi:MAG: hypothetical protein L3K26_16965 [Candidatus Hydrogenedentes bacterium]|nr:hypothetical protein [Candidatus Hydrogenedentota bacterium]
MKTNWTYVAVLSLLFLPACQSMPSRVRDERDALRLPPDTRSVSARDLADEDMRALFRFRNLDFLTFLSGWANTEAQLTDHGLAILAERDWPALRCLQIGYNKNITDQGLKTLAGMDMPSLEILILVANPYITDEGIRHISGMRQVTDLNLSISPRLTDKGLKYLSEASQLRWLALDECDGITDEGVSYLMGMPNLKTLYLAGCKQVSPTWGEKYPDKIYIKVYTYDGPGADENRARIEEIKRMGTVGID